ncbi:IclR family transcriptional regulator [Fulvimarina endophytica]|uniref:IclR family transcriptional regulator n=1 Tax=Fulvimarina endophytica TaxID=2293836 RepID=A0A371X4K1_9HYPH|nr:IclR family transcriptional regulator C-terminal domain-containing protein [Fulvimarina endophytica]RFC64165.1 IclR family transcriptional regulator [Fulvimarina endophytica]
MSDEPLMRSAGFVGSLGKAMRILEAFGAETPRLGLTELSRMTGLDRSSVQRITTTLFDLGYLTKDPATRRFSPSLRMTELANAFLWADPLMQTVMPRLIDLHRSLGETVNFARLDGSDIVYVARLPNVRTSYAATIIGRRVPALNTSSGRAMLARKDPETRRRLVAEWPLKRFTPETLMDRDEIARQVETAARTGYAVATNELQMNERAVAVAIRGAPGFEGAIHCALSASDWPPERVREAIVPSLIDTANAIG